MYKFPTLFTATASTVDLGMVKCATTKQCPVLGLEPLLSLLSLFNYDIQLHKMAGYLRIVRKDTELFYHVEGVKKATNFS